jgi:hypothetical protein
VIETGIEQELPAHRSSLEALKTADTRHAVFRGQNGEECLLHKVSGQSPKSCLLVVFIRKGAGFLQFEPLPPPFLRDV